MFTQQPDFLKKIAARVGRVPFLKRKLRNMYDYYINSITGHRNALFHKNGIKVLKAFDECLTSNGFTYTLAFGTMLGAIREQGFIPHDLDIDVAMWSEDYSPRLCNCLKNNGFSLIRKLVVDEGKSGREETYEHKGVTIDIFFIYPAIDQHPYCCDFVNHSDSVSFADSMNKHGSIIPRRLQLPWKKELERIPFEGLQLPICANAHEILSFRYGNDYMIPNRNWRYTDDNKNTTVWTEKKGIMKKK